MTTPRRRTAGRPPVRVRRPRPDEGMLDVLAMTTAVLVVAVLIRVGFPDRSDYVGHFLAGAGGTAAALAVLTASARRPWPLAVVALCLLAMGAGTVTEATIFREAAYDWVDFALQSSGAGLAATAFVGGGGRRAGLGFVLGSALFLTGCVVALG